MASEALRSWRYEEVLGDQGPWWSEEVWYLMGREDPDGLMTSKLAWLGLFRVSLTLIGTGFASGPS